MKKEINRLEIMCRQKPRPGHSLLEKFPDLDKEWDYDKNNPLTPRDVSYGTTHRAHWICPKNHTYIMQINNRTSSQKSDCPYCSIGGNRVWDGNCLGKRCPKLVEEWHPHKNGCLTPYDVTFSSPRKVWWKCKKCNSEWLASIEQRRLGHRKCPVCCSLDYCYPELSKEWHRSKNGKLMPQNVTFASGKKAWWICSNGHEWRASIYHRSIGGTGCPLCCKIILKDGTKCDSVTEAYFYLKFKGKDSDIKHHVRQNILGKSRYFVFDFYFPKDNKYVEVTGLGKRWMRVWRGYLRQIYKKKQYVENILGAKFEFLQKRLTLEETKYVRRNTI